MALITNSFIMDLSILLGSLFGLLYWYATKNFDHWRKKGIPYFEPKPFVGNLIDIVLGKTSMGELLAKLYFESRGKPYMGMFGFHRPLLLIRDEAIIKSVLVKDFNSFRDRTFSPDETQDPMFAKNLFGLKGARWRHARVKLTPTFSSGKMKIMYDLVNECGKDLINLVERELKGESGVLEVRELLARYTTDVIASVGFGLQGNALKDPDAEFRRVLRLLVDFNLAKSIKVAAAFFAPKLLSALQLRIWDSELAAFSRRVVWQTVEHRQKTGLVRKDFLDLLMQLKERERVEGDGPVDGPQQSPGANAKAADANENFALEGDDFVAQAFVFMAAGFETSSSTLTFALHQLACHPDAQTRLREEIRRTLRDCDGRLTYDAVFAMAYLDHVVQETLRLHPILPFLDRVCNEPYPLPGSGAIIEKGTTVMIPIYGIQRDPELYDEPEAFRPERFEESQNNPPPLPHMSFGEGPRICIGMRMGLLQVKLGLIHFLNHFEVLPCKHTQMNVALNPQSFLLASKDPMLLTVNKLHDAIV